MSHTEFALRPVEAADEAALRAVYASARAPEMAVVPWSAAEKEAFLRFQYEAQLRHYRSEYPEATLEAVVVEDRVVGRLIVDQRAREIRVLDLALLEGHRGQGIGATIVRDLQRQALVDSRNVSVYVEPWQESIHVFEHLGFRRTEETELSVLMVWSPQRPDAEGE